MQQMCRCKFRITRRATELAPARPQNTKANVKVLSLLNYHQILYRHNAQHSKTTTDIRNPRNHAERGKGMYKPPSWHPGLSQDELTGRSKAGPTSMYHSEFNLSSNMYKIRILFTAHRVVLLSECRSRHDLVHQILEPYTVVAATA